MLLTLGDLVQKLSLFVDLVPKSLLTVDFVGLVPKRSLKIMKIWMKIWGQWH